MARRLFLLAAAAELVGAGDGAGGLDIALGPTVGSSPFGALGPSVILPGLIAGPSTLDPRLTPAALPLVTITSKLRRCPSACSRRAWVCRCITDNKFAAQHRGLK